MSVARVLPGLFALTLACSTAIDAPDPETVLTGVTFTRADVSGPTTQRVVARLPADALASFTAWSSGTLAGATVRVYSPTGALLREVTSRGTHVRVDGFRAGPAGGDVVAQVEWTTGAGVASYRFDVLSTAADPFRVERLVPLTIADVPAPRAGGVLVTLPATETRGERVLVAGGYTAGSQKAAGPILVRGDAALIDPLTGTTEITGSLVNARAFATGTLITEGSPDLVGKVLVVGGLSPSGDALATTELYDPVEGSFSRGPDLVEPRAFLTALPVTGTGSFLDGKILFAGGELTRSIPQNDLDNGLYAEVDENPRELFYYDPTEGAIRAISPKLTSGRVGLAPVLLSDGRIFFIGGGVDTLPSRPGCVETPAGSCHCNPGGTVPLCTEYRDCVEGVCEYTNFTRKDLATAAIDVYDTSVGTFDELPASAWLRHPRLGHVAAALPGDRILVAGGATAWRRSFQASEGSLPEAPVSLDSVELFEPETSTWRVLPPLSTGRDGGALLRFGEDDVTLVGGVVNVPGQADGVAVVERYLRTGEAFEARSLLGVPRYQPMVARVNGGTAWLVVGGEVDSTGPTDAIELITARVVAGEGDGSSDGDADVIESGDAETTDDTSGSGDGE